MTRNFSRFTFQQQGSSPFALGLSIVAAPRGLEKPAVAAKDKARRPVKRVTLEGIRKDSDELEVQVITDDSPWDDNEIFCNGYTFPFFLSWQQLVIPAYSEQRTHVSISFGICITQT